MQKSWYRQIPLTPLDETSTAELLASLLGTHPTIASLAGPVHARTGGNPFFIEEVAQNLIETKHVEGSGGNYRLVTALDRLEVPATVKSILASRIDRLPEREKRLLQTASVIGKDFPETLLAQIASLAPDELKSAIANLRRAEFIHELSLYPTVEYAFKHPLTQEVALGSLLTERKRRIHRALAKAIERQEADHLDERAPLLAHHWEEAGEVLAAARWNKRAAEWVAATDMDAAARHWRKVRTLVGQLPKDREAAALGIVACQQVLGFTWRVGKGAEETRAVLVEGQALATEIGDQRMHLTLAMLYSKARGGEGDTAEFLDVSRDNYRIACERHDLATQANAAGLLIDALGHAVRISEVLDFAEAGLKKFPRTIPPEEWTWGFNPTTPVSFWRAVCLLWTGRLQEGFAEFERTLRWAAEDNTPEALPFLFAWQAEAYYRMAEPEKALASAIQAQLNSRNAGDPPHTGGYAQMALAYAYLAAGRPADAIEPARHSKAMLARAEQVVIAMGPRLLAEALLETGDLAAAIAEAEHAIQLARHSLKGNLEAEAHGILARALLRRDGATAREAAERALATAGALIESTGAKVLSPALLEWRAELAAVLGDEASRASLIKQAAESFDAIGAPLQAVRLRKETDA
jgi:adenylate cyclase